MHNYLYTLEIAFDSSKTSQVLANSQDTPYCWGFTQQIDSNQEQPLHSNKLSFQSSAGDTCQFRLRIGDIYQYNPNAVITNLWLTFSPKNTATQPKTTPFAEASAPPLTYDFNNGNFKGTSQTLLSMNLTKNCWLIGDPNSAVLQTPWSIQNQGSWEFSVWFCVLPDIQDSANVRLFKVDPEMDVDGSKEGGPIPEV